MNVAEEKRAGKDRRADADRRGVKKKVWFMTIGLVDKRGPLDRRAGLDRREDLTADFRREALVQISRKGMIKHWDSAKAKMTYLWDTGMKVITFSSFEKGAAVEVTVNTHQGRMVLPGHVLRFQKLFTEHGFATEMEVQFEALNDSKRALINELIWGD